MRSVGLTEESSPFNPLRQQDEGAPLALLLLIAGEIHTSLDVSRLEHQEVPLSHSRHSVHTLMRSVEEQLSPLATASQVGLSFEVQSAMRMLWIDQDMIRRVLVNLVMNAIKYSPRGGQVLIVASRQEECIQFSVGDQGPGIPPEYQWRIFDKFARVQIKGAPSGTGLGLAFCRLAVEAHGGHIWVESTPWQGSTFLFTLPLVEPAQDSHEVLVEASKSTERVN